MATSILTNRSSNLSLLSAVNINYSTLTGSTIIDNTMTVNRIHYSTITGSSIATNSLLLASTLTGSSIILSGNVGIGSNAPAYTLDLGSNTIGCGAVNTPSVTTKGTGNLTVATQSTGLLILNSQGGALALQSAGSTLFSVTASSTYSLLTATADMTLQTGGTNSTLYISAKGTGFISLGTNSNTRVLINSSGYVGIGTDGPSAPLHIAPTVYASGTLSPVLGATTNSSFLLTTTAIAYGLNIVGSNTGAVHFQSQYFNGTVNPLAITLNPMGGYVGIGTTSPGDCLQINGKIGSGYWTNACMRITNGFNSTEGLTQNGTSIQLTNAYNSAYFNMMTYGYEAGSISSFYIHSDTGVGVVLSRGSNIWGTYSDARMKICITPITTTLSSIMLLEPVSYLYETDPDNHSCISCRVGFTAQNVNNVYPHLVTKDGSPSYTNKNGDTFIPMTLTTTDLIPYLVKGIQEQQTEITDLKAQLAALKATVDALVTSTRHLIL